MSRLVCRKHCCRPQHAYRDDSAPIVPSDLDNEPIALFARDRFPADVNYDAIEMSCRLASRLMLSPGACKYIATMTSGEVRLINADGSTGDVVHDLSTLTDTDKIVRTPLDRHMNDIAGNRNEAENVLQALAEMVHIWVHVDLPETVSGLTNPAPDTGDVSLAALGTIYSRGVKSRETNVFLDRKTVYEQLVNLHTGAETSSAPEALAIAQFHFAEVLVHEVGGHSLNKALHGARDAEPFYEDCGLVEAGFDLCTAIFGGVVQQEAEFSDKNMASCFKSFARAVKVQDARPLLYEKPYYLRAWPCPCIQADYEQGHKETGAKTIRSRVGILTGPARFKRIPFKALNDLLTRAGWQQLESQWTTPGPMPLETHGDFVYEGATYRSKNSPPRTALGGKRDLEGDDDEGESSASKGSPSRKRRHG